jgi:2'-5' RNA ligase
VPAPTRNPPANTWRVFFALWPDAAVRDAMVALARDVVGRAGGRMPSEGNLHLTLAFVGDVAKDRLSALDHMGGTAAQRAAPFTLVLDRIGGFDDAGIAWLGADTLPADLTHLVQRLNEGLAAQRFRVDRRPFAAHVTLARRCRAPPVGEIEPIPWTVRRLSLVASELGAGGSRYRSLASWALGPPP